jgi:hypothetical protein
MDSLFLRSSSVCHLTLSSSSFFLSSPKYLLLSLSFIIIFALACEMASLSRRRSSVLLLLFLLLLLLFLSFYSSLIGMSFKGKGIGITSFHGRIDVPGRLFGTIRIRFHRIHGPPPYALLSVTQHISQLGPHQFPT